MDQNLRALCRAAIAHEQAALKSMALVTDVYKKNRQVLVKRHSESQRRPRLENPQR